MTRTDSTTKINTRTLAGGAVVLSELGFGAAPIGNLYRKVSAAQARQAVLEALGQGIRYFDSAPFYGFGLSEKRLGSALAGCDHRPVLSTKVGRLLKPVQHSMRQALRYGFASEEQFEPAFDYTYDGVMHSFEESLRRLGVERIPILFVHDLGVVTHGDAATWRGVRAVE